MNVIVVSIICSPSEFVPSVVGLPPRGRGERRAECENKSEKCVRERLFHALGGSRAEGARRAPRTYCAAYANHSVRYTT